MHIIKKILFATVIIIAALVLGWLVYVWCINAWNARCNSAADIERIIRFSLGNESAQITDISYEHTNAFSVLNTAKLI